MKQLSLEEEDILAEKVKELKVKTGGNAIELKSQ